MIFEFQFQNNEEKNLILNNNSNLYLIEMKYLKVGNFLVFSDLPTTQILLEEQSTKISILEAENETLKQELSITQDAVNELIFNSLNI